MMLNVTFGALLGGGCRAHRPIRGVEAALQGIGPRIGNYARSSAPVDLGELHEATDLAGAVRLVAADRDALLPGGSNLLVVRTGAVLIQQTGVR